MFEGIIIKYNSIKSHRILLFKSILEQSKC